MKEVTRKARVAKGERDRGKVTGGRMDYCARLTFGALHPAEKGIALVMVLWVLVLLSIVALNFLGSGRWNTASTRNLKDETASYYLALSGFHEALNYLMLDKNPAADFSDTDGNFWADREKPSVTGRRDTEAGEVDISITDEDSKLNINRASPEQLRQLFMYAGVADDAIPGIVDAILDWKDPDREERLLGAEDTYYEGLAEPYKAKNGPFDLPEELGLVKGVMPEYLYGGGEFRAILPLITTFGAGSMNINTVSAGVMQFMGLNNFEVEAVLKQRTLDTGGFRTAPQQFVERGLNAQTPANLRVEVRAKATNSSQTSKITAVVRRQPGGKGFRIQTIYWRERAEGIRS